MRFFFARSHKIPFVLNTHGSLLGYKKYLPSKAHHLPYQIYDAATLKLSAKRADAIVVSSELEFDDAIEFGIPRRKLHIIPMGIDVENLGERIIPAQESSELKILFVGRLARVRRIELILQAVSQLAIPYSLTIVGGEEKTSSLSKTGYLGELTKLAEDLQISEKVHFVGRKAPEELKAYYQNAEVFVYPSLYENFSQPILEAGAMALPIIATEVGVAREIVKDGDTGFLVPGDPVAIRDRLLQMTDPELRSSMGEAIRKVVQQHYSWDQVLQKYVDLYRSLT